MDGAAKDVSTIAKPLIGEGAAERATTPIDIDAPSDRIPAADAQASAMEKMVKENAALTAASKINAELLANAQRGASNVAQAAKLATGQARSVIGVPYAGGNALFEPPDGATIGPSVVLLEGQQ